MSPFLWHGIMCMMQLVCVMFESCLCGDVCRRGTSTFRHLFALAWVEGGGLNWRWREILAGGSVALWNEKLQAKDWLQPLGPQSGDRLMPGDQRLFYSYIHLTEFLQLCKFSLSPPKFWPLCYFASSLFILCVFTPLLWLKTDVPTCGTTPLFRFKMHERNN